MRANRFRNALGGDEPRYPTDRCVNCGNVAAAHQRDPERYAWTCPTLARGLIVGQPSPDPMDVLLTPPQTKDELMERRQLLDELNARMTIGEAVKRSNKLNAIQARFKASKMASRDEKQRQAQIDRQEERAAGEDRISRRMARDLAAATQEKQIYELAQMLGAPVEDVRAFAYRMGPQQWTALWERRAEVFTELARYREAEAAKTAAMQLERDRQALLRAVRVRQEGREEAESGAGAYFEWGGITRSPSPMIRGGGQPAKPKPHQAPAVALDQPRRYFDED